MDVSIIMPVYNAELYLEKCLESVLSQKTDYHYEVITVNDGSNDNSLNILNKYKDKIIIIDKKNTGPGDSRNIAIKKAKGKYLMFVDSDDYVSEYFVDEMCNAVTRNNASAAICDFYRDCDGEITVLDKGKDKIYEKNNINDVLLMEFHSCNKIFKKQLIIDNPYPVNIFYEDVVAISKALIMADKIVKINKPLYYYRKNNLSTTNILSDTNYDILTAMNMVEDVFLKNNYFDEIEYLYVNNILVDLCIKIFRSSNKNQIGQVNNLKKQVLKKYPNCFNNKYLKNERLMKRAYLFCLKNNLYFIIKLIYRNR